MYVKTFTAIALCAASAFASAQTMTKAEHDAAKDRIEMDYKNAKKACDSMKDNAKDVCQVEAKGNEKVARAELEHKYKTTEANARKHEMAKADAAYDLAKEKCEDQAGDAMKVCKADAKAVHERAVNAAKGKA